MLLSRTISSMVATVSTVVALGAQTFTTVDVPFAAACQQVSSINPAGNMVGAYLDTAGVIHGYIMRAGAFATSDFPGSIQSRANDINAEGTTVGRYISRDGVSHGYILRGGQFASIEIPGAIFTGVNKISNAGDMVGRHQTPDGRFHGFLLGRRDAELPERILTPACRHHPLWLRQTTQPRRFQRQIEDMRPLLKHVDAGAGL